MVLDYGKLGFWPSDMDSDKTSLVGTDGIWAGGSVDCRVTRTPPFSLSWPSRRVNDAALMPERPNTPPNLRSAPYAFGHTRIGRIHTANAGVAGADGIFGDEGKQLPAAKRRCINGCMRRSERAARQPRHGPTAGRRRRSYALNWALEVAAGQKSHRLEQTMTIKPAERDTHRRLSGTRYTSAPSKKCTLHPKTRQGRSGRALRWGAWW